MGVNFKQGKTNKFFAKRLRVTRTGKILARKAGHDHFNAKAPRRSQLAMKKDAQLSIGKKELGRYLPNK